MFDTLRSETLKTLSTKGTIVLLVGGVAVVALATASTMLSMPPANLEGPIHEQVAYFIGSVVLVVFALIVGMRSFTDEFRHGTVLTTVLVSSSRTELLVAKAIVTMGVTLTMSVLGLATLTVVALSLSGAKGGALDLAGSDWSAFAGLVSAMLVWTVVGVGLGALIRNQVAAVVGALVWVLVAENFAGGFIGEAARLMPGQLSNAMADVSSTTSLLGALPAALLLIGYALLISFAAGVTLDRRDVI
ncbi:MAG TPA: ABC transporter permease [Acidimicrobiia bacterium]